MNNRKIELLVKVVAWRFFSMLYSFAIAYFFTGNISESAGIVFITGTTLTFIQWMFEIFWDRFARARIRHAISEQQGRIDRLVWWRRSPRVVSMDEHNEGSDGGEKVPDLFSSKDAG